MRVVFQHYSTDRYHVVRTITDLSLLRYPTAVGIDLKRGHLTGNHLPFIFQTKFREYIFNINYHSKLNYFEFD